MTNKPITARSDPARMFMAMPLVFGALLMAAVGLLAFLVWRGGTPVGPRIAVTLSGQCFDTAQPLIRRRVAGMGLGEPVFDRDGARLRITATLPGIDAEREQRQIPIRLSQVGALSVFDGEEPLMEGSQGVESVGLQLDENGAAMAVVELDKDVARALGTHVHDHPDGALTIRLDAEVVAQRPNSALLETTELRIIGEQTLPAERMQAAADQVIVLQHGPLPCAIEVVEVRAVE
ncbi:MAG: hypothetical protein AAFV53_33760 [Myxococcota bacterium]